MQHLYDDNEDLLRRAADQYPLKIQPGNWDDLAPVMLPAKAGVEKSRRKINASRILLSVTTLMAILGIAVLFEPVPSRRFPLTTQSADLRFSLQPATKGTDRGGNNHPGTLLRTARKKVAFAMAGSRLVPPAPAEATEKQVVHANKQLPVPPSLVTGHSTWKSIGHRSNAYAADIRKAGSGHVLLTRVVPATTAMAVNLIQAVPSIPSAQPPFTTPKRKGFYLSLEGGFQLNQVKGQGFNAAGFSGGFTAGFQLNKRIAAETGLSWSQKHFQTDGRYFDMSKAGSGMPPNMTVLSMSSCTNIIEIPILLKFNPGRANPSPFFIRAGISSYILTRESNDYLAVINGQQQGVKGRYTDSRHYFAAAAQLGVGMEYKTPAGSTFRVEPYVQMPLRGIGIGSVQVMTAGLHLGVTRYTHR